MRACCCAGTCWARCWMSEQGPTPKLHLIPPDGQLPHGGAEEVGNKAFNLMRMAVAGLPVPPGFVLPVDWCALSRTGETAGAALRETLATGIARVEAATDLRFGSIRRPLLVSVRS